VPGSRSPRSGVTAEPVAVVGLACRVPGAEDPDGFAELLLAGHQQFTDIPDDRMPGYDAAATGVHPIRAALLERADLFDGALLSIGPRMTAWMDPQQYHLLELTWRALESAAIPPAALAGTDTAVYVSTTSADFRDLRVRSGSVDRYSFLHITPVWLANRISHQFDLRGPSILVDTACAGGLTTVALAVGALRAGDTDVAIAGSANLLADGYAQDVMTRMSVVSPTGTPRPFDAGADGYVRGEGVFVFVLKRLADALADHDPVHAVIYGSGMNHDGRGGGLVRPDSASQRRLFERSLRQAGADITDLGYVEAHAAGAPVGDAIEATTLRQMLDDRPDGPASHAAGPDGRLWVGSVKSNIGHLEGAAGAASLVKAILVLKYGAIPPTPGFRGPPDDAGPGDTPLAFVDRTVDWPRPAGGRRLIGVNSFGFGGANANVVLGDGPEPGPAPAAPAAPTTGWPVPVSAHTPEALSQLAGALAAHLGGERPDAFVSVVRTLQHGRAHLRHRRIVVADSTATLREGLRLLAEGRSGPRLIRPGDAPADPAVRDWLDGTGDEWPATVSAPDVQRLPLVPYPFQWRAQRGAGHRPVPPPHSASWNPVSGLR
jgi:acyl transferase domain-containing protein